MFLYLMVTVYLLWMAYKMFFKSATVGEYNKRYVFITGCDTGFGNLLTKKLDVMGFNVFAGCLTQKGMDKLDSETSNKVKVVQLDVTKTDSIQEAFQLVKTSLPKDTGLWGLVNNAGIAGPVAPSHWLTKKDYRLTIEINTMGMVESSRIFLPLIVKAKGRVVNITSMMGRIAAASAPYVISKFAAEGYSDLLRREVYKRGVTVHILEPGFFATDIVNKENIYKSVDTTFNNLPLEEQKYYGESFLKNMKDIANETIDKFASPDVHLVVDAYIHALTSTSPNYRYIVGKDARYFFQILWNIPEWISDYILTRQIQLPESEQ